MYRTGTIQEYYTYMEFQKTVAELHSDLHVNMAHRQRTVHIRPPQAPLSF